MCYFSAKISVALPELLCSLGGSIIITNGIILILIFVIPIFNIVF